MTLRCYLQLQGLETLVEMALTVPENVFAEACRYVYCIAISHRSPIRA